MILHHYVINKSHNSGNRPYKEEYLVEEHSVFGSLAAIMKDWVVRDWIVVCLLMFCTAINCKLLEDSTVVSIFYSAGDHLQCTAGTTLVVGTVQSNFTAGRVSICDGTRWRTVCGIDWDMNDTRVVCRQLGFPPEGTMHCIPSNKQLINSLSRSSVLHRLMPWWQKPPRSYQLQVQGNRNQALRL